MPPGVVVRLRQDTRSARPPHRPVPAILGSFIGRGPGAAAGTNFSNRALCVLWQKNTEKPR